MLFPIGGYMFNKKKVIC